MDYLDVMSGEKSIEEAVRGQEDSMVSPPPSPVIQNEAVAGSRAPLPDPTRYGDWERSGRCIDF